MNLSVKDDHDVLVWLAATFQEYRQAMEARLEKMNELRDQVVQDR
jgi:hypothetical protein